MATKKVRLKSTDKKDILHPETDDSLILNKKLLVEDSSNAFEISDENQNTILEIDNNGNLKTSNFDSDNIQYTDIKNKPVLSEETDNAFEISDEAGNVLMEINKEGVIKTSSFDSSDADKVDDVKVNGTSVVTDKIANIELPVKTDESNNAFEISDENQNTILEIDNDGNLKTKNFDSTEMLQDIQVDDKSVVTDNIAKINSEDFIKLKDVKIDDKSIVTDKVANISKSEINNVSDIQVDGKSILTDKIANIDSNNFGKVDDVKVNGTSIVTDKVANIELPVNTSSSNSALEITDESNNTVLEIDSEGNLNTKNFDSASTNSDIQGLKNNVSSISSKIPTQATSDNQLADKDFVNSSISTATATFRGLKTTLAQIKAQTGDLNDYCILKVTNSLGNVERYDRYKYTDKVSTETGNWDLEYTLNNSSFTDAQWEAINSGITDTLVAMITSTSSSLSSHISNKSNPHGVTKAQVGLGNVVNTGDSATPTQNGTTKFTTGGAYTLQQRINTNATNITNEIANREQGDRDTLTSAKTYAEGLFATDSEVTTMLTEVFGS